MTANTSICAGRVRRCVRIGLTAVRCGLSALCALSPVLEAQVSEELFALGDHPYQGLLRLDAQTGETLGIQRADLPPGYIWHGLAFDGARFVAPAIRGGNHPAYTAWLGPCEPFHLGPLYVAGQFGNMSIDVDPATGRIWGVGQDVSGPSKLWEIDTLTGVAIIRGALHGATTFATGIAFDPAGTCYLTDAFGPRLFTLDTASGATTFVSDIPIDTGYFEDITIDLHGDFLGYFTSQLTYRRGLYRFSLSAPIPTLVKPMPAPHQGIAFARFPSPVNLCAGKTNSAGCVPTIEMAGFPSASGVIGCTIRGRSALNNTLGILIFGVNGPSTVPFAGGTLCLAAPYYRTVPRPSSGNLTGVDCSGIWELDFIEEIRRREILGLQPTLSPGHVVSMQWFGRDPGLGQPNPFSLSNALAITLMP